MIWFILLNYIYACQSSDCPETSPICWDDDDYDRLSYYTGSKTSYEHASKKGNLQEPFEEDFGCQARKVWMFIRHGTRYPKSHQITEIKRRLCDIQDKVMYNQPSECLCHRKFDSLINWNWDNLDESYNHNLTPSGAQELEGLGKRLKTKFPHLLREYSPEYFKFAHTATERAKDSAKHFAIGFFGQNVSIDFPQPASLNHILRAYKTCNNWRSVVKKNPETYQEVDKFQNSSYVSEVVRRINYRLGLKEIGYEDVISMYEVCAYENAWNGTRVSPWCSLFSENDFAVINYEEDLELYYKDGPYHPLSRQMACGTLTDIIENIEGVVNGGDSVGGVFYFSHCGAILKLFSLLGFFYDESPLRSDNFDQKKSRSWHSSEMVPFGSNMLLTVYHCSDSYKISVHISEKLIFLPFCEGHPLCPVPVFLNWAQTVRSRECRSLEEICDGPHWFGAAFQFIVLMLIPFLTGFWLFYRNIPTGQG